MRERERERERKRDETRYEKGDALFGVVESARQAHVPRLGVALGRLGAPLRLGQLAPQRRHLVAQSFRLNTTP